MAATIDDLIKAIEKAMSQAAGNAAANAGAAEVAKIAKERRKAADAMEKEADAAERSLRASQNKLKDLQQEESRLQKIGKLTKGADARLEAQIERKKRLNELEVAALETKKAEQQLELASTDRAADPQKYKEIADSIAELDEQMKRKNVTTLKETQILSANATGYKQAIQFVEQSALVYGKHEFANTAMLSSFRNLAAAMKTPTVMFELVRAGITSLINTMFAFTMSIDVETHAIMRNTGASEDNAKAMMANVQQLALYGVEAKDVTEAVTSLRTGFQDFTFYATETQAEIKDTSALLNQLGVSFNDSTKAMQNMAVTMGMTGTATAAAARDMTDFAHIIQVVPSELMSNFAAAGDSLAKFGDEGISSFKELAIRSKVTTLEVEKMLRMVEKFDTFEGAAEQAGKLNAALGGNFVNAMDLMMTTNPAERFDMIRDSILNTGLTFDDMSYYQRKFFTEAAGLESVADLAKVMRGDFSGMAGDVMKSSDEFEKLAKRTKDVQDIQQKFKTLLMSMIPVFEPLIDNLQKLLENMSTEEFKAMSKDVMESVKSIAGILVAIIPHLDTIVYSMATLGSLNAFATLSTSFSSVRKALSGLGGMLSGAMAKMKGLGSISSSAAGNIGGMIGPIQQSTETLGGLADTGSSATGAMDNLSGSMNRTGPAAKGAGSGMIQVGVAALLMGAGIGLAALGVAELVKAFSGLGDAAMPAALGILAFGGALALFMIGMKFLLPVIAAGSVGLGMFAGVIILIAGAFALMASSTAKAASSIGEMFKQMGTAKMGDFKTLMGYFTTGSGSVTAGINAVRENIDQLVTSINAITVDNITALGDAMMAVSSAASAETTSLKNDMEAIMNMVNEASLPKINATTALIGAVGSASTASGGGDPMSGFDKRRDGRGEKPVVKVYIGDTELKQTIRTEINNRLAEFGQ